MKQTPDKNKLDEFMRSSRLVAGGFLGHDTRGVDEIIEADAATVFALGRTTVGIAERMREVSLQARRGLGMWVDIDAAHRAMMEEARGELVCPWPHPGHFHKAVTTVQRTDTGETAEFSDLNIHMVEAHGFFEGRGSRFRIEPERLIQVLF
ncbi:MAG TPA: hypothetical protein ENN81_08755 [Phycisphaerales bacterium]|nr:hypothetical protein [Phycisphaerales bacterium]